MRAQVGDVELEYELHGPDDGVPVVLIAGIFQQLTFWNEVLLRELTDAGMRVLIFDNRDVGLSTIEAREPPDPVAVVAGDLSGVNYTLSDMARDTAGLIDEVGFGSAHVLGHSMGGMIAQRLVIEHPERVRSLVLMSTSPMDMVTGQPASVFTALFLRPGTADPAEAYARIVEAYRLCERPDPVDEARLEAFAKRQEDRAPNPDMQCMQASFATTHEGMRSSPTHLEQLAMISQPTLVIHGIGDLLVCEDGGERLAELIPGAELLLIDAMGHIPQAPERWDAIADEVISHIEAS